MTDIETSLYNWLEEHWRKDNINKYQHLFKEWIKNITPAQIIGYRKQMYNDVNKVLG